MHISEGVLQPQILIGGAVIGLALLSFSVKKLKNEDIAKTAVFSAVFFVASFIHVPIGVTSIHLILSGLVGAFLGYSSALAIFIALFLQALLFGYGGLTILGVNTALMGAPAIVAFWIFKFKTKSKVLTNIKYFLIGFVPIFISSIFLSLVLALNGEEFYKVSSLAFISNLPIMFIEGIICYFSLHFIQKVAPKYLRT